MSDRSFALNALIGGIVSVLTGFVPFSPILGGALAGYLNEGEGLKVGALSGVFAALPAAIILTLIGSIFTIAPAGESLALGLGFGLLFVVILVVASLYTVALGAIGGYVGVYLFEERAGGDAESDVAV